MSLTPIHSEMDKLLFATQRNQLSYLGFANNKIIRFHAPHQICLNEVHAQRASGPINKTEYFFLN